LNPAKFIGTTGYHIRDWDEMIAELAVDNTEYDEWRGCHATF